jgi:hypothetical protein
MECEAIRETSLKIKDIPLENTNSIVKDVEVFVCNNCDSVIDMPSSSEEKIKLELDKYKANRPSIDTLLKDIPEESKIRWCSSQMCACAGAANCSGKLSSHAYTKKDWIIWKDTYDVLNKNWIIEFDFKDLSPIIGYRMLADLLNLTPHQAKSMLLSCNKVDVEYDNLTQNEINESLQLFTEKMELKGALVEYSVANEDNKEYHIPSFIISHI